MMRPMLTATVSRTKARSFVVPWSCSGDGDTRAAQVDLTGDLEQPLGVVVVGDEQHVVDALGVEERRRGAHRLPRGATVHLLADRRVGHPVGTQVVIAGGRLRELVAGLATAGGDENRRKSPAVQLERVVEPGLEHRRRASVVLRGTQHDDRPRVRGVGPGRVVTVRRRDDLGEGERDVQDAEHPQHEACQASRRHQE